MYAVLQQPCKQKEGLKLDKPVLCIDGDTWKQQNPDVWKQYGTKCEIIYTDTGSLLLEVQTDDVYKDIEE